MVFGESIFVANGVLHFYMHVQMEAIVVPDTLDAICAMTSDTSASAIRSASDAACGSAGLR
ncbi:MAG: hypothetical protein M3O32_00600 [Actinomycetota bacterium]|nr:hypothetical protein [Actinomycetota bacterium]